MKLGKYLKEFTDKHHVNSLPKMKEFNLSDKILYPSHYSWTEKLRVKDVKEFIKLLKVYFNDAKNGRRISILPSEFRAVIDKLAGSLLVEERKLK